MLVIASISDDRLCVRLPWKETSSHLDMKIDMNRLYESHKIRTWSERAIDVGCGWETQTGGRTIFFFSFVSFARDILMYVFTVRWNPNRKCPRSDASWAWVGSDLCLRLNRNSFRKSPFLIWNRFRMNSSQFPVNFLKHIKDYNFRHKRVN